MTMRSSWSVDESLKEEMEGERRGLGLHLPLLQIGLRRGKWM